MLSTHTHQFFASRVYTHNDVCDPSSTINACCICHGSERWNLAEFVIFAALGGQANHNTRNAMDLLISVASTPSQQTSYCLLPKCGRFSSQFLPCQTCQKKWIENQAVFSVLEMMSHGPDFDSMCIWWVQGSEAGTLIPVLYYWKSWPVLKSVNEET